MVRPPQSRILRNYRSKTPSQFYTLLLRVWKCLTDNPHIPVSVWAANPELLSLFLALAAKYHEVFQRAASYASKLDIAERDVIQAQLIAYMDEIASVLEAAAVRNPEVLITSGFDLAKERRGIRASAPQASSEDAKVPGEQTQS
ncbi:hypothetical protein M1B72_02205 [Geomonas paludis]|uniref:Uncharacterized protein n=1 Tax=Geomonas paludis TaxID=2740185 RepID=A0A6V8MYS8_9BACT|nr:hypothetical protein [Geomonas paludis]UPU36536.1 hypothetical protein M1B72_02205 [Geomonas paludis]GFO65281.1 hypothetical protein GMPD_32000 [Geomonas paludis]